MKAESGNNFHQVDYKVVPLNSIYKTQKRSTKEENEYYDNYHQRRHSNEFNQEWRSNVVEQTQQSINEQVLTVKEA